MDINPAQFKYSQTDITPNGGENTTMGPDDWTPTVAINTQNPHPEAFGLPPKSAAPEKVYEIAAAMSASRGRLGVGGDGVYCPICHIASIDLKKLDAPCPKCGRKLLRFGWD